MVDYLKLVIIIDCHVLSFGSLKISPDITTTSTCQRVLWKACFFVFFFAYFSALSDQITEDFFFFFAHPQEVVPKLSKHCWDELSHPGLVASPPVSIGDIGQMALNIPSPSDNFCYCICARYTCDELGLGQGIKRRIRIIFLKIGRTVQELHAKTRLQIWVDGYARALKVQTGNLVQRISSRSPIKVPNFQTLYQMVL